MNRKASQKTNTTVGVSFLKAKAIQTVTGVRSLFKSIIMDLYGIHLFAGILIKKTLRQNL